MATWGLTWSAVWVLPGALREAPEEATLNGVPLSRLRTGLRLHPPRIAAPTPVRHPVLVVAEGRTIHGVKLEVVRAVVTRERFVSADCIGTQDQVNVLPSSSVSSIAFE